MWQEFYRLEPFGQERRDLRAGAVAAAVYNVNRTKRSQKVLSPVDFIFKFDSGRTDSDGHRTWQNASPAVFADFKAYMIATSK